MAVVVIVIREGMERGRARGERGRGAERGRGGSVVAVAVLMVAPM